MSWPLSFHDGRALLYGGDCLDVLDAMEAESVDSVVTDPPYHLTSIVKRFGGRNAAPAQHGTNGLYARASTGFMGMEWDGGDISFLAETWAKVLRVLKPGGHLVAFSGPKCSHRMVCAIEDAGFEIRDGLMWMFGCGFPKSHSALKPAYEPICLARKPLGGTTVAANVLAHGTGAINIDACRVETKEDNRRTSCGGENGLAGTGTFKIRARTVDEFPEGLGRWPANVIHDGSAEVQAEFPNSVGGGINKTGLSHGYGRSIPPGKGFSDSGSVARFFYSAKADARDRIGSKHPTVKPVDLMRWLCRLVTQPGGLILDPFAGTGTTGEAALLEGFRVALIEREAEYRADIERRMAHVFDGTDTRGYAVAKAKGADAHESLPLFGGAA